MIMVEVGQVGDKHDISLNYTFQNFTIFDIYVLQIMRMKMLKLSLLQKLTYQVKNMIISPKMVGILILGDDYASEDLYALKLQSIGEGDNMTHIET